MKKIFFFLLMCLFVSIVTTAQSEINFPSGREKHDHKPQLFAHLSQRFLVKTGFVNDLMNLKVNDPLQEVVTEGFVFSGKIISKTIEGNGLETIIAESQQKKGLLLSVSRYKKPDGSIEFSGIITSRDISDIMMMEKDAITGSYLWARKNISQVIAD